MEGGEELIEKFGLFVRLFVCRDDGDFERNWIRRVDESFSILFVDDRFFSVYLFRYTINSLYRRLLSL